MKTTIAIVLTAMCALAAVGAVGASAAETTAYTCVSTQNGYSDPDCSIVTESGSFGHDPIPANTLTTLSLDHGTNHVFKTIIAGASVTIESTGVVCVGCTAENKGSAGAMEVFGTGGRLEFTGVTVPSALNKCTVEDTSGKMGIILSEKLTWQSTGTNELTIKPATGNVLATFRLVTSAGQKCAPAGAVEVKGDVNGTLKGAYMTVNVSTSSKTLTVGVNGASLTGETTLTASNGTTTKPVALT